jgi:hypothetical protein
MRKLWKIPRRGDLLKIRWMVMGSQQEVSYRIGAGKRCRLIMGIIRPFSRVSPSPYTFPATNTSNSTPKGEEKYSRY